MTAGRIWFLGENGALHVHDLPLPEGLQHRLDRGDLVRVSEDGTPWTETADDPVEVADVPPPDAPPLPRRTANRRTWIDFAISQGMDRERANNLTRAELVEALASEPDGS